MITDEQVNFISISLHFPMQWISDMILVSFASNKFVKMQQIFNEDLFSFRAIKMNHRSMCRDIYQWLLTIGCILIICWNRNCSSNNLFIITKQNSPWLMLIKAILPYFPFEIFYCWFSQLGRVKPIIYWRPPTQICYFRIKLAVWAVRPVFNS